MKKNFFLLFCITFLLQNCLCMDENNPNSDQEANIEKRCITNCSQKFIENELNNIQLMDNEELKKHNYLFMQCLQKCRQKRQQEKPKENEYR